MIVQVCATTRVYYSLWDSGVPRRRLGQIITVIPIGLFRI
jgi:hypothetical protein